MPTPSRPPRASARALLPGATATAALLSALALGCSETSPTAPATPGMSAAKGGTGGTTTSVTVNAANPSYGDQGAVGLNVQITGSGFDGSAQAQWILSGDTLPSPKIKVNKTTFVSSTQVVANIDIDPNATIDLYNIAVVLSTGKKGIGNELFAVTQAQPLGFNGGALGLNDASQIVGAASGNAFFWDPANPGGHQTLGPGSAVGIDEAGLTISGQGDGSGMPLVWTRTGPGVAWPTVAGHLPAPNGGIARGLGSDPTTGLAKYIVGEFSVPTGPRSSYAAPARWTRDIATGTWTLEPLQMRPGSTCCYVVRRVSAKGQAAGWGQGLGLVWEDAVTQPTVLLPLPGQTTSQARGIDPTGLYAAGWSHGTAKGSGHPVVWRRDPATRAWNPNPIDLRSPNCADGGQAEAVNPEGIVVGSDCGAPVAWRVTATGIQRLDLGGLGPANKADVVNSVASGSQPFGAGRAKNGDALRWFIVFP